MFSTLISDVSYGSWLGEFVQNCRGWLIPLVFLLLLAVEGNVARQEQKTVNYRRSYAANFGTLLCNEGGLSIFSVLSLYSLVEPYTGNGILSGLPDSFFKTVLSFILLDITLYFWHRANHTVNWLWMFHRIHHSDPVMNVSTSFRLHFIEVCLTMLVKALFMVLVGIEFRVIALNEVIITLFILFHHTRVTFPGERWLGKWLFITPLLHRLHHSVERDEHDSNYGAVFSWWDRLFGSLQEREPSQIGLKNVPDLTVLQLLMFGWTTPFVPEKPRSYVANANGTIPYIGEEEPLLRLVRHGLCSPPARKRVLDLRKMIAEAAYYRAEKRGFVPGYEWSDWLEAEKEVKWMTVRAS